MTRHWTHIHQPFFMVFLYFFLSLPIACFALSVAGHPSPSVMFHVTTHSLPLPPLSSLSVYIHHLFGYFVRILHPSFGFFLPITIIARWT